jgi:hypothetical protein
MGCFDYVNYTCKCPKCGADVSGFQSKDGGCVFETKEMSDVLNFYTSCDQCSEWIEFNRIQNFKVSENFKAGMQDMFNKLKVSINSIGNIEALKSDILKQIEDKDTIANLNNIDDFKMIHYEIKRNEEDLK